MKASELRLGNLVQSGKGIYRIYAHSVQQLFALQHMNADIESESNVVSADSAIINPIPLTEEWLLKFGFTWDENVLILELKSFLIEFQPEGDNFGCLLESIGLEINYVHQLQNLYFALTGTELDIKQ